MVSSLFSDQNVSCISHFVQAEDTATEIQVQVTSRFYKIEILQNDSIAMCILRMRDLFSKNDRQKWITYS